MTSSTQTCPPDWLSSLIEQCLASLYLLNLEGCPAADSVGKTARLWVRLLREKCEWREPTDAKRVKQAFASIANDCRRWPAPATFWDHLPPREEIHRAPGKGLHPDWGRERQAEALACMYRTFAEMGRDRWGNVIAEPALAAPTVTNPEQLAGYVRDAYGDRKLAAAGA